MFRLKIEESMGADRARNAVSLLHAGEGTFLGHLAVEPRIECQRASERTSIEAHLAYNVATSSPGR